MQGIQFSHLLKPVFFENCPLLFQEIQSFFYLWPYQEIEFSSSNFISKVMCKEDSLKLILLTNNYKTSDIGFIANYDNVVFVTEIPFDLKKADVDVEQTNERLLLGMSKEALMLGNKKLNTFEYLEPLFKFEKRPMAVTNLNEFSELEIKRFDIKPYRNSLN